MSSLKCKIKMLLNNIICKYFLVGYDLSFNSITMNSEESKVVLYFVFRF